MNGSVSSLVFIHLSDIHFRYDWTGSDYDLDRFVRDELKQSIATVAKPFDRIDGILLSGDVAFAGNVAEYTYAEKWVADLTKIVGCPPANVFTIPGNHDVDRDVIAQNSFIHDFHDDIRSDKDNVDDKLRSYSRDPVKAEALFAPLGAYTKFASQFGCFTTPQKPFWDKSFELENGLKLRLRGVNSALLCDKRDGNVARNQLAVGEYQSSIPRDPSTLSILMCHHPPRWLVDEENFDLCTLAPGIAPLQLFGHEHQFQIDKREHSLRLYAGAVHPSRKEINWEPRYNVIEVKPSGQRGILERVHINVWAMAWHHTNRRFEPDKDHCPGGQPYTWTRTMDDEQPKIARPIDPRSPDTGDPSQPANQTVTDPSIKKVDVIQQLVNAYLLLPYHVKADIASDLDLVSDDDEGSDTLEQYRRYIERIEQREYGFAQLWNKVAAIESSRIFGNTSPFEEGDNG